MNSSRIFHTLLAIGLATVGFVGWQPSAEAGCTANIGGYCAGNCDVNVVATCWPGGDCTVNALATCGSWTGADWASCFVNAVFATCTGWCFVNAGYADCSGSCFINAGIADCSGWCAVNAGSAWCSGGCLVNAGASSCDSTACALGPRTDAASMVCFFYGCTVNAALSYCGPTATCTVNVVSSCYGDCTVNVLSPEIYIISASDSSIPLWLGCGETGSCTVNVAARCDGDCTVNAAFARCEQTGSCAVNVLATCRALRDVLA